jgi:hypothetical protein
LFATADEVGKVQLGANASILADPGASVSLSAGRQIIVDGLISAPGGNISLNLATPLPGGSGGIDYSPIRGIWLGSNAKLLAPGSTARLSTDAGGVTRGALLDGGSISIGRPQIAGLGAAVGYVVADPSAVLDVSGVDAGVIRLASGSQSGGISVTPEPVASAGGNITVRAREGLWWQAKLLAAPGRPSVRGGSLTFALDREGAEAPPPYPQIPSDLVIGSAAERDPSLNPSLISGANLSSLSGRGWIDTAIFSTAGFDRLSFKSDSSISLANNTRLAARSGIALDTPVLRARTDTATAKIEAAWVQIGNQDDLTQTRAQAWIDSRGSNAGTTSSLEVVANTVDIVGQSAIDRFASSLVSAQEAIRLSGRPVATPTSVDRSTPDQLGLQGGLLSSGALSLRAEQVFPTTLTDFSIKLLSPLPTSGAFRVLPPDATLSDSTQPPAPVFSALGTLAIEARTIEQGGRLSAPHGTIRLTGSEAVRMLPGSTTSVAGSSAFVQ